jgi:V/A-type H+-transporting ATPase subunit E
MPEELQHLIDRIKKEAVDAGEKQASDIVSLAREKAAATVRDAEQKAAALVEKAEKDAQVFTERSLQTLAQAARDLLISVGQGVENIVGDLAVEAVDVALKPEVLQQMIVRMAEAYVKNGARDGRIEILLSPDDQARLVRLFQEHYAHHLRDGLVLRSDTNVFKGFKVSLSGAQLRHDFTREAIAEALSTFLRPHLAEIVTRVAREGQARNGG